VKTYENHDSQHRDSMHGFFKRHERIFWGQLAPCFDIVTMIF